MKHTTFAITIVLVFVGLAGTVFAGTVGEEDFESPPSTEGFSLIDSPLVGDGNVGSLTNPGGTGNPGGSLDVDYDTAGILIPEVDRLQTTTTPFAGNQDYSSQSLTFEFYGGPVGPPAQLNLFFTSGTGITWYYNVNPSLGWQTNTVSFASDAGWL